MRAEKQYLISEVETHLKKSDYVILANFTKVTVADTAELRKRLAVEKAEFHVVKNSSLRVAAKALGLPELEASLAGPTAVVVGGKNSAGVAKILKKVADEEQPGLIILGKQAIDDDSNQTGQMLAALLGWSQGTFASKLEVDGSDFKVTREVDGGLQTVKLK